MNEPVLRTAIQVPPSSWQIPAQAHLLALGSCFAEQIGARFSAAKFPTSINPLGIAYHPLALADLVQEGLKQHWDLAPMYADHLQSWIHFKLHSQLNAPDEERFAQGLQHRTQLLTEALETADYLLLTFGTAVVFRHLESGQLVNNCHKFPSRTFHKQTLTPAQIVTAWKGVFSQLFHHRPDLKVVLTVSPIRHTKEGLARNALSKSILRVACEELANEWAQVQYFPSYEIMLDDLRDYRFYAADLIHPNEVALQYIWEIFTDAYLAPAALLQVKAWQQIQQGLNHRPLQAWSTNYQQFLHRLYQQIEAFAETYEADCQVELRKVDQKMEQKN